MKALKIIFIILGVILIGVGILGVLGNFAGSCPYSSSESALPDWIVKINKISPAGTTLDFDCTRLSTINNQSIDKIETISKTNLPFGGTTDEGYPDYSKNWSFKATINGQVIEAEGSFTLTAWGYYLHYSHWILLLGIILFIASFFIKLKKFQPASPQNP